MTAPTSLAPLVSRWLSGSIAVSDHPTDERIIDAAVDELRRRGVRKLALEDVASRARVSRMTVYRRFRSRERLIESTFARETSRLLTAVAAADDPEADAADRIATAFATALVAVRRHPLAAHWLADDAGYLLNAVLADDAQVLRAGSSFIAAGVRELDPAGERQGRDPERIAELLVRLFAGVVLMPPPSIDPGEPAAAESLARDLVAPIVLGGSAE